jgi:hypothetical protein
MGVLSDPTVVFETEGAQELFVAFQVATTDPF